MLYAAEKVHKKYNGKEIRSLTLYIFTVPTDSNILDSINLLIVIHIAAGG